MKDESFRCADCGEVFDLPDISYEFHAEVNASEPWAACPYCGGTDLERVTVCPVCEETYIPFDDTLCPVCEETVISDLKCIIYNHCDEKTRAGIAILFPDLCLE